MKKKWEKKQKWWKQKKLYKEKRILSESGKEESKYLWNEKADIKIQKKRG